MENMINAVLRNLITNGIKFTKKGGITITVESRSSYCLVCFKDTGTGISKDTINTLFTFENTSTKGTDGENGTGLGLLLCKEFILRNGGKITVNSIVREGSTFCVEIPLYNCEIHS